MKEADKIKLFDGDEILVHLDQKTKTEWKGHLYDVCCNCGYRHHTIFRVQVGKKAPELTFETYADLYGSKLKKRKR